jgi:hypothetical protein
MVRGTAAHRAFVYDADEIRRALPAPGKSQFEGTEAESKRWPTRFEFTPLGGRRRGRCFNPGSVARMGNK